MSNESRIKELREELARLEKESDSELKGNCGGEIVEHAKMYLAIPHANQCSYDFLFYKHYEIKYGESNWKNTLKEVKASYGK